MPSARRRAVAQPAEERVAEHRHQRADPGDQRQAARRGVDADQRVDLQREGDQQRRDEDQAGAHERQRRRGATKPRPTRVQRRPGLESLRASRRRMRSPGPSSAPRVGPSCARSRSPSSRHRARDQALRPAPAAGTGAATAAERAPRPRGRVEAGARVRAGGLRQDHAAHRVAGRPLAPTESRSVAWLSLGPRRQRPGALLDLRRRRPADRSRRTSARARSSCCRRRRRCRSEAVLTTLLNDLGAIADDVVLVLDDYHVIESREVHDGDGVPAGPPAAAAAPGHRQPGRPATAARAAARARGELVEVRAADLRFTADEAAAYLNGSMGLDADGGDVATLEGRTEGWIAALQLAALSMQGRDDASATSSPASRATTGTSSTTSSRRSCSASRWRCRTSCCRLRCWAG